MKKGRVLFSIFFLTLLTLVNASPLHTFAHQQNADDDCIENCAICDIALEIKFEDYQFCEIQSLEGIPFVFISKKQSSYKSITVTIEIDGNPFCRPPPSLS